MEGVNTLAYFELVEIVDDSNPYPILLGIDCAIVMNGVIKLKKRTILFERKLVCVVVLLDLVEGSCYIEPIHGYEESDDDFNQIYKIIAWDQDWINQKTDGWIEWDRKSSCTLDSHEELEHWHNQLH